jgi:ribose-phosphate pyrophosphokinase
VHILQSTSKPVNEHVMELFFMVSAAKRAGAASITCIIPYYGYARQERKHINRAVPISSADIAQMLEFLGVNKIVTLDIHAPAVTGSTTAKVCFEDHEASFVAVDFFEKELPRGE